MLTFQKKKKGMHRPVVESAAGTTHERGNPGRSGGRSPASLLAINQFQQTHGTCAPASPGCCGRRVGGGEILRAAGLCESRSSGLRP